MRTLTELINEEESALPLVKQWAEAGEVPCEVLPPSADCDRILVDLQVTTRSPMGAISHGTGGVLVGGGWLRILGSGHPRLNRNIADWNRGRSSGFLLVADDVVGGFFAINGGALGPDAGSMYFLAPDSLEWEALNLGYTDFLLWSFSSRLHTFYASLRWTGWEADVKALEPDQCMNFYPFLWAEQGSAEGSSRKAVDISEQYAFNVSNLNG